MGHRVLPKGSMPQVTALKSFPYDGRTVERGEAVEMPAVDAAIHARKQNVSLTKRTETRDMTAADDREPAPRKRRSYRRRDLTAEP